MVVQEKEIPLMIKKVVAAAALVIGLAGYAEAQEAASPARPAAFFRASPSHHSQHHKQTPKPVKLCEGCWF